MSKTMPLLFGKEYKKSNDPKDKSLYIILALTHFFDAYEGDWEPAVIYFDKEEPDTLLTVPDWYFDTNFELKGSDDE